MATNTTKLLQTLLEIRNLCDAPHWSAERRWKIRDKAQAALSQAAVDTLDRREG